jgi:hypothetical protein
MVSIEPSGLEAQVCPLLGLESDRRTRYTYPHPDHRCFAKERAATTDARRQASYCLDPAFTACDRFQARERRARKPANEDVPAGMGEGLPGTTVPGSRAPGTVVHVFRAGDSLERLATIYGLTVEQIAQANGLQVNAVVAEGTRLVIPLSASSRDRPDHTAAGPRGVGSD